MGISGDDGGNGVESRQLIIVSVCLFGLVTAAFLAPVTNENEPIGVDGGAVPTGLIADLVEFLLGQSPDFGAEPSSDGPKSPGPVPDWLIDIFENLPLIGGDDSQSSEKRDEDGGGNGGDGGGGGSVPDWLRDLLDGISGTGSGGGEPSACQVYVESDPKPGVETIVLVEVNREPERGVRVWFNDKFVGRTDERGLVAGQVPYVQKLDVTVQSPTDEPCAFSRQPGIGQSGASMAGSDGATIGASASGATGAGAVPSAVGAGPAGSALVANGDQLRQQGTPSNGANNTSQYDVAGDVQIRTEGDPYPNTTVTVIATAAGVPMRNATVTVAGERVGETDATGRYRLRLPDRDSVQIAVERGEINGQTTVNIWEVSVGFAPKLVVPGETVSINVTRDGAPVNNTTVTLDGRSLGTTRQNGQLTFTLPRSVSGTVRATTDAGDATVPLWHAYLFTAGASLLLAGLSATSTWLTARRRDRSTARRVALWWVGVAVLFVGFVIWELPGLAVAAGVVALVGLVRYRRAVRAGGATAAQQIAAVLEWCRRRVLWCVSALETTVDWIRRQARRLTAWLRSLPTSLSALALQLRGWFRKRLDRIRAMSRRRAGAVVGAIGLVAAATYAGGARGFVLSAGLVTVAAVVWWFRQRNQNTGTTGPAIEPATGEGPGATTAADSAVPTIREIWRRLARWVTPSDWRTRTPAEVSQAAIEKGLPQGPVDALTDAFRNVEYGGQSERTRREQARAAFERLELDREEEEDEEP